MRVGKVVAQAAEGRGRCACRTLEEERDTVAAGGYLDFDSDIQQCPEIPYVLSYKTAEVGADHGRIEGICLGKNLVRILDCDILLEALKLSHERSSFGGLQNHLHLEGGGEKLKNKIHFNTPKTAANFYFQPLV